MKRESKIEYIVTIDARARKALAKHVKGETYNEMGTK